MKNDLICQKVSIGVYLWMCIFKQKILELQPVVGGHVKDKIMETVVKQMGRTGDKNRIRRTQTADSGEEVKNQKVGGIDK